MSRYLEDRKPAKHIVPETERQTNRAVHTSPAHTLQDKAVLNNERDGYAEHSAAADKHTQGNKLENKHDLHNTTAEHTPASIPQSSENSASPLNAHTDDKQAGFHNTMRDAELQPHKARQHKQYAKYQDTQTDSLPPKVATNEQPVENPATHTSTQDTEPQKVKDSAQDTVFDSDSHGKLKFKSTEAVPDVQKIAHSRKPGRVRMEREAHKPEKVESKLTDKKKPSKAATADANKAKAKKKLKFEEAAKHQGTDVKGLHPVNPVTAAGGVALQGAHRKLYETENENVGTKAAHRAEMMAEDGVRSALRGGKNLKHKAETGKSVKLTHQRKAAQKQKGKAARKAMQKRRIKSEYAKAAHKAQKAAKGAGKAGATAARSTGTIARTITSHPGVVIGVIAAVILMMCILPSISMCGGLGSGGLGSFVASTYLAQDADMLAAEAAYAAMEDELQNELDNYESLHPGYDEYVYDLDEIWHDPYVLISILSALHEGEWTLNDVQGTLTMLFDRQYILTETVTVETRYREVITYESDPITGVIYEVVTYEAYNYYICTVTLENFNLSHLPIYIMSEANLSRYALYMWTLGNRPDLFPNGQYPHASEYKEYLHYDIPPEYLAADPIFAAMIAEANKYLGMPYVWGGYNPNTSFDCSGYVSWVLNQTGWNIGRLGAQGLYNYSTIVSPSEARPGDLVFFTRTYAAENPNGATHVGIYVGDGMMVHAGNPIGYASIETQYYRDHFLAFGRIY